MERPPDLPDFKAPPVREVAIGVQFERIPALSQAHVGLFWSMIRDDYPVTRDQEPLSSQVEDLSGTPMTPMTPLFMIEFGPTPPLRRAWFLNPDGSRLVQLQQDRLVHNWRYQDEPYPRFEPLAEAFQGLQESFFGLVESLGLPVPKVEQVEVTYINWIPAAWMNEVVKFVAIPSLPDGLSAPDNGVLSTRFLVSDEGDPVGRLYVEATSAVSQEAGTVETGYLLNLTFRAPQQGGGERSETTRLMLRGREAIVQAFTAFTPEDLHKAWERPTVTLLEEQHEVRRPRPTGASPVGLIRQPERTARVQVPASVGPEWLDEVVTRLERLRPGRCEEAVPEQVLVDALDGLNQFLPADAAAPAVAPTGNGGVQFEWHRAGWDVEVEFHQADSYAWAENLSTGERWSGALAERLNDLRATMRVVTSH